MLKFIKVYTDSSYKVRGTSSDFTIDLPETVQLADNMLCQIHDVSIPHSWYSINDTKKMYLYIYVYVMRGLRGESKIKGVRMSGDMLFWELLEG